MVNVFNYMDNFIFVISLNRKIKFKMCIRDSCKMDESYICLDGPVYDYSKAKTLID